MQGTEMKVIRERLGMTELQLARAIGYTGTDRNDDMRIREYERGKKQIPLYIARLVWLIDVSSSGPMPTWPGYVDDDKSIIWPEWPGYEFEHTPDREIDDPDTAYVDRGQFKATRR